MASITRETNGRRTIQFVAADGLRKSIRLGRFGQRQAEAVKVRVEQLAAALASGHVPDLETTRWGAGASEELHRKLAPVGLVPRRAALTLGPFLDQYIASRTDVKANTKTVWTQTRRNLLEFCSAEKLLGDFTRGDADRFRLYLKSEELAEATIGKRLQFAKQFFEAAVRDELIATNPFSGIKTPAASNRDRFYFVTRDEAARVLSACPDVQWRLLFALSRFGGLRCPSEHLALKWTDINWAEDKLVVTSSKTEHHGKGSRVIPLFPELRSLLQEAFDRAEPGDVYVITRYRSTNANLRTQLLRIIGRAGLKTWPRLFQNLRSTRETELKESFPVHAVRDWIGNSPAVANKHYLQTT